MDFKKNLYYLQTEAITIDINLGWVGETLVLEGYDIGKTVEQLHLDGKSQAEKIRTVVGYVKSNYNWNNIYSFLAVFIMSRDGSAKLDFI